MSHIWTEMRCSSVISAPPSDYKVLKMLGAGTYGSVLLCKKESTQQEVALKMMNSEEYVLSGRREMALLQYLKQLGSEQHHLVRWNDGFKFEGRICLEFEKLDISLHDFIRQRKRLTFMQIRPILYQLAKGVSFLHKNGFMHGDLKPENVMMVNHRENLQVKIIDLGLAQTVCGVTHGSIVQTCFYRAPEVFVGAPYNEAADMWSLGCITVEMLLGSALFKANSEAQSLRDVIRTLGMPPDSVLNTGLYTADYFVQQPVRGALKWKLKPQEPGANREQRMLNSLKDLYFLESSINNYNQLDLHTDWVNFMDLLEHMLDPDPQSRISAEDALMHPFLSMSHLHGVFDTPHVNQCLEVMCSVTRLQDISLPEDVLLPEDVPLPNEDNCTPKPNSSVPRESPGSPLVSRKRKRNNSQEDTRKRPSHKSAVLPEDVPLPDEDDWLPSRSKRPDTLIPKALACLHPHPMARKNEGGNKRRAHHRSQSARRVKRQRLSPCVSKGDSGPSQQQAAAPHCRKRSHEDQEDEKVGACTTEEILTRKRRREEQQGR